MQTSIEQIEPIVKEVARDLGLQRVVLFGSLARGTQSARSDIDLIVIRETTERFVERPTEILNCLPFTVHYSLFTVHYSLFTA